jgi:hypothetical protein
MRTFPILWFTQASTLCAMCLMGTVQVWSQPAAQPGGGAAATTKPCFTCNKTGTTKCSETTCRNGKAECPGPCLKLTKGTWIKREMPGRNDPTELWQARRVGNKTWYFSSKHLGEYYTFDASGQPVAHGCNVCGGSTTVECKACGGKGTIACPTCAGKKVVPESWTAFDHPKLKNRPSRFRLKDGSVLIGRTVTVFGTTATIRTEQGDVKIEQADIVAEEKQKSQ